MAAGRYEIYLRVLKNISWVSAANEWNIFQHEKINFVSPSDHVIFFFINDISNAYWCLWRFPKDFWRFSKICLKARQAFPKNVLKISVCVSKITKDDQRRSMLSEVKLTKKCQVLFKDKSHFFKDYFSTQFDCFELHQKSPHETKNSSMRCFTHKIVSC